MEDAAAETGAAASEVCGLTRIHGAARKQAEKRAGTAGVAVRRDPDPFLREALALR